MELLKASASNLGDAIGKGEVCPIVLTQTYLDAIKAHWATEKIFTLICEERALAEAEYAKKRAIANARLSPLDGVPVSWKDLFDLKGEPTLAGCQLLDGRVGEDDAEVVKRAQNAGMISLGKTHMTELAFSGLGINPKTQTPPCFYDHEGAPGGSSSGSGTSVAFGLAPISIGSDTGGSVRIPSVWNGLVGLKTTHGRVSLKGVVPLCASFDTVGPLCRSVEDASNMFAILTDDYHAYSEQRPLSDLRFLVCETAMFDHCEHESLKGFESAVSRLKAAGATIEYGPIDELNEMVKLGPIMFPHEAWNEWGDVIAANPARMFEPVRKRFEAGRDISDHADKQARQAMMGLRKMYQQKVRGFDAVLAPSVPIMPPHVEALLADHDLFWDVNMKALSNTRYANMFGLCALTLPTEIPATGIMFMGLGGEDEKLLAMGKLIESLLK